MVIRIMDGNARPSPIFPNTLGRISAQMAPPDAIVGGWNESPLSLKGTTSSYFVFHRRE
jgi:hypothetical protein